MLFDARSDSSSSCWLARRMPVGAPASSIPPTREARTDEEHRRCGVDPADAPQLCIVIANELGNHDEGEHADQPSSQAVRSQRAAKRRCDEEDANEAEEEGPMSHENDEIRIFEGNPV